MGEGPFDWTLARRDDALPDQLVRGMWIAPTWSEDDELRSLFLLDHLNGPAPFDVPWEPREGDVFTAHLKGRELVFRHDGEAWIEDDSSPLAPWATQMVEQHRGTVVLPPDAIPAELLEQAERPPVETNRAVLRDWILSDGHPTLAGWLRAREAGQPFPREEQVSERLRGRLEQLFSLPAR